MLRPAVLLLAVLLSASTLWSAFMDGSMSITTALTRFLIAVPVAAVMVHLWSTVTATRKRPPARRGAAPETEG